MGNFIDRPISTQEDLLGWVDEMKQRERSRYRSIMIDWLNNLAAFHGRSDMKLNDELRIASRLTIEQRQELEQIAENWVQPHVRTLAAHMQKSRPKLEAVPSTTDESDIQAAKVGDRFLRSEWSQQDMDTERLAMSMWQSCVGNAFWHSFYDKTLGPRLENGMSIGQIVTKTTNPFKVVLEPHRDKISSCRWAIITERLPKDEVDAAFSESYAKLNNGQTLKLSGLGSKGNQVGDNITDSYMSIVGIELGKSHSDTDFVDVDILYHVPTKRYPEGLYAFICDGRLLYVDSFPYREFMNRIPIFHFREILAPWRFHGETSTTQVLRNQEYFVSLRKIERTYLRKHARGKWLVPKGCRIRKDALKSSDPNDDVVPYVATDGLKPEFIQGHAPPANLYTSMNNARESGNQASGVNEASRGGLPSGVTAGRAILALQEMDATRFGLTTQANETEYGAWGHAVLGMGRAFYSEKRKYQIAGEALEGSVFFFDRADLKNTTDVRCVTGSSLPDNKLAKRQEVREDFKLGVFGNPQSPEAGMKVRKMLEYGQSEDVYDDNALDEQVAEKENISMFGMGEQLLGQGVQDPMQLQQAVMPVGQFDDHLLHVKVHLRRWKKPGVRDNPPMASIIGQHIAQHMAALNPNPAPPQPGELPADQVIQAKAKGNSPANGKNLQSNPLQSEGSLKKEPTDQGITTSDLPPRGE